MATAQERAARLWQSPSLWLVGSNLLTRLLGFVVSLLISRLAGVASLGVYSSVLISAASLTTPVSQALANSATLMVAHQQGTQGWRRVLAGHAPVLGLCAAVVLLGPWFLLSRTADEGFGGVDTALVYGVVAMLALGQLLSHFMLGLAHGANRSLQVSWLVSAVMVVALITCAPMLNWFGMSGALLQAALVVAAPGVVLWFVVMRRRRAAAAADSPADAPAVRQEAWQRFGQAMPNIGSTFINNGTNWLCSIYWVQQHHGHLGVGLVAIGLQWMAVMQLPVGSWGGRIVHGLATASRQGPGELRAEMGRQVRKCVLVSLAMGLAVMAVSPWIADLYNADRQLLIGLLAINAAASVLAGATYVFERVFFCLDSQRMWLWVSMGAYVVQLAFTVVAVRHSLYAVALGNLLAIATIGVIVHFHLRSRLAARQPEPYA